MIFEVIPQWISHCVIVPVYVDLPVWYPVSCGLQLRRKIFKIKESCTTNTAKIRQSNRRFISVANQNAK